MLEGIFKGLALWLYGLMLSGVEYISNALLDVFQMDMTYFETAVPVSKDIFAIIVAVGWALLIGNLTFQSIKTMLSGIGFEGEDPKILFCRSFVFGFLLLASRQICEIGMSISNSVIDLLQVPTSVIIPSISENEFSFDGSWVFVMIVGIVMSYQIIKFFFQMGERYVIMAILTILAPLAFGVGGSKNTEDIFKGFIRMFASMCVMMVMNVVFLKILLSVISTVPSGIAVIPWLILIVGIGRVARKIDDLVSRIGMSSARTGEPLSRRNIPGMLTMMVVRNLASTVSKTASANGRGTASSGSVSGRKSGFGTSRSKQNPASSPDMGTGSSFSSNNTANSNNYPNAGNHFNQSGAQNASQSTSQSAEQNMSSNANSTQKNNSQMASSVAGSVIGSTMAGMQGTKVGDTQPNRPVSQNLNNQQASRQKQPPQGATRQETSAVAGTASAGTVSPTRPPLGRNNTRQEKRFSGKVGENVQNNSNSSVVNGDISAGNSQRPQAQSQFNGNEKQVSSRESVATASAETTTPSRPPLGRSGMTSRDIMSQSARETSSVSRNEGLGRNQPQAGATSQATINNSSSETSQNVPSTLGRKQSQTGGVSHTTSPNMPVRSSQIGGMAQNVSKFPSEARFAGGGSPRNSPEIYTRHSETDTPPLQTQSLKNKNSNVKEAVPTTKRPPIGRRGNIKGDSFGGDRR